MVNTPIKERPILFSAPMVRAILDGRKSQTRRAIKPQPRSTFLGPQVFQPVVSNQSGLALPGPEQFGIFDTWGEWSTKCPYGQPGDQLWVRETTWYRKTDGITTYADGSMRTHPSAIVGNFYAQADDFENWPKIAKSFGFKSVPSIHMPRWASRITLEVTGVRVERLNDISREDSIAEGIEPSGGERNSWKDYIEQAQGLVNPINSFCSLWRMINGPGSWTANPWVWVVEFKRVKP
jgi:hypothetical protein